jgi:hypothetical protein
MSSGTTTRILARGLAAGLAAAAALAPTAAASPFDPSGVLRLAPHPSAQLKANQSTNWFGYNQGTIEQGGKLFSSVTSAWTVPAASQHTPGEAESSATWIGIGGGCIDAGCTLNDATLIQAGTEQDVDSSGHPSYSAWWELVPAPSITIANMTVSAGDRITASVAEAPTGSSIWTITLKDVTRNETFSTTVPYPSTHSTAEWIEETPLTIGSGASGQAPLPKLTKTVFENATANGASAHLMPAEELQLVDSSNKVIGTPSAPNSAANGFAACAWATLCALPSSGSSTIKRASKPAPKKHPKPRAKRKHKSRPHSHHRSKKHARS